VGKKTVIASIDAGNGFTNGVSGRMTGKVRKDAFPSVRCAAPESSLGLGADYEIDYHIVEWGGERYTYGDEAIRLSAKGLERHHGQERYGDEFHGMLVALSLFRMGVMSGSAVDLTLFMPPGLLTDAYRGYVIAAFSDGLSITVDGEEHSWSFDRVVVRPEGVGAITSFMLSPTKKVLNHTIFDGYVLIVDAGTYTLDIMLVRDGRFDSESLATATWESDGMFRHIITPLVNKVRGSKYDDFKIENYDPHPAIKAPVAV
jgi:hypothetical protein